MNNLLNINSGRAFKILIMIILLDFLTGLVRAIIKNEFNVNQLILGLLKKIGYIALIALCNMIDLLFDTGGELRLMSIAFLVGIDGISLLENLNDIGVPIPERIKSILNNFNKIIISKNNENKIEITKTGSDLVNENSSNENVETLEINNFDEIKVILPQDGNENFDEGK